MADVAVLPADPAAAFKRAQQGKSYWRHNDEYRHALKTWSNVSWVETFIKPCAFGAPQAATGLDKHLHPGAGVAMSCRTMPRPEKPLDIGRLI